MIVDKGISRAERICVIVASGLGSKVFKTAHRCGIPGATILRGRGSAGGRLLEFLGLAEVHWDLVMMAADRRTAREVLAKLDAEFQFDRPNHGIAFSTGIYSLADSRCCPESEQADDKREGQKLFHAITVIVDKGRAEDVVEAARKAGAKGGTILSGRGSGVNETRKLFNMDVEPEREMVLILAKTDKSEAIADRIRKDMDLDAPGKGILFVQEVLCAYGLVV